MKDRLPFERGIIVIRLEYIVISPSICRQVSDRIRGRLDEEVPARHVEAVSICREAFTLVDAGAYLSSISNKDTA